MTRAKNPTTLRLERAIKKHQLKRIDICELLGCSLKTVSCWRAESPRAISEKEIERLELKLQLREMQKRLAYLEAKLGPVAEVRHA